MAPFLKPFIVLVAITALADVAIGANYTVGAPIGSWDLKTNYEEWVKDLKFYPGDLLIFNYTSSHDVAEVTKDDYTSCSTSNELTYDNSGTTVIELTTDGTRYFICAAPTHCSSGMKVKIDVLAKPSSPPEYTSPASTLAPASEPPATSPAPPPVNPNKAAVAQHGVSVVVLGLIGLMLATL